MRMQKIFSDNIQNIKTDESQVHIVKQNERNTHKKTKLEYQFIVQKFV